MHNAPSFNRTIRLIIIIGNFDYSVNLNTDRILWLFYNSLDNETTYDARTIYDCEQ